MLPTFRIVVVGDSVAWGQGLVDSNKYIFQVAAAYEKEFQVDLVIKAHSGASITGQGSVIPTAATPEVPWGSPTILDQVSSVPNPASVDLVLINGGINDVSVEAILDPAITDDELLKSIHKYCYDEMKILLSSAINTFSKPSCKFILTGYYPILSSNSDPIGEAELMLEHFLGSYGLGFPRTLNRDDVVSGIVAHSKLFWEQSNAFLRQAATEIAAASGIRNRLSFVQAPIGVENSMFTKEPWLWGFTKDFLPEDEVTSQRQSACTLQYGNLLQLVPREMCYHASSGHPNLLGARAFSKAILSVLGMPPAIPTPALPPRKHLLNFENLSRWTFQNHWRKACTHAGLDAESGKFTTLVMFEPRAWWEWIISYVRDTFRPKHAFLGEDDFREIPSVFIIPNENRISVAGDWGTGTEEAERVGCEMLKWPQGETDLTIHLGDVYYIGDEREVRANYLGGEGLVNPRSDGVRWPRGRMGSLSLNGNHEMYAKGYGYFDVLLPTQGITAPGMPLKGQGRSFFCLENDHWRIVGLDTAYNSTGFPFIERLPPFAPQCDLPPALMDWLEKQKKRWCTEIPKATVLLSHHQCISAFDEEYLQPAKQLTQVFDKSLLWLWGHEHRLAGYREARVEGLTVHGRCIGHGGMPIEAVGPSTNKDPSRLLFYDARPNFRYPPESAGTPVGFNGFAQLHFLNERLTVSYLSLDVDDPQNPTRYVPNARLLLDETFTSNNGEVVATPPVKRCSDDLFILK